MLRRILLLLCFSSLLIACSFPAPSQAETTSLALASQEEVYPEAGSAMPAYPAPDQSRAPTYALGEMPLAPSSAPDPEPGKASISGVLFSYTIRQIVPETAFYLTPAVGPDYLDMPPILIGPRPEKGDIYGRSAADGQIAVNDIPPGNYFLVVWAPYNWSVAQVSDADNSPLLLELLADQMQQLGVIFLSWP
jgi:hypothetical protein